MYIFKPPTVREGPAGGHWLFRRYYLDRGISVLKVDGEYYEVRTPSQDETALASIVYLGGHEYEVSDEEAAELIAAGYEPEEVS